jgi:hypothetical protein
MSGFLPIRTVFEGRPLGRLGEGPALVGFSVKHCSPPKALGMLNANPTVRLDRLKELRQLSDYNVLAHLIAVPALKHTWRLKGASEV